MGSLRGSLFVWRTEPGNGGGTDRRRDIPPLLKESGWASSTVFGSGASRGRRGARGIVLLCAENELGMGWVSGDVRAAGFAAGTTMAPLVDAAGRGLAGAVPGSPPDNFGASTPRRVFSGPRLLAGPTGETLRVRAPRAAAMAAVASSAIVKAGCHSFIPSRHTSVEGKSEPDDKASRSSLVGSSRSTP